MQADEHSGASKITAADKFSKYSKVDPFPSIPPSLLNSADIADYINATGMIDPFRLDDLKSASYAARIGSEVVWWDKQGNKTERWLNDYDPKEFTLEPNSIAFIQIEPYFRLPEYIALRFNLKISNIYRGLLVGTGPLIDPGFVGKIYVPLHNMTTNTYRFSYLEPIIWIEFTKTSPITTSGKHEIDLKVRSSEYVPFPLNKRDVPLGQYLADAVGSSSVVNSIPAAIAKAYEWAENAKKEAENAKKEAESARRYARNISWGAGIVALLTILLGILPIFLTAIDMYRTFRGDVIVVKDGLAEEGKHRDGLAGRIDGDLKKVGDNLKKLNEDSDLQTKTIEQQRVAIDELRKAIQSQVAPVTNP